MKTQTKKARRAYRNSKHRDPCTPLQVAGFVIGTFRTFSVKGQDNLKSLCEILYTIWREERLETLKARRSCHRWLYYNGVPEMSDQDYDCMCEEIVDLEGELGLK